jgi:hypothetical protein
MKKMVFGILIGFVVFTILSITLVSCMGPQKPAEYVTITTQFYVTDIIVAKYSRVEGYIIYKGNQIPAHNGSSGYYYKKYSLKPGDVINVQVDISTSNNGFDATTLRTSGVDLSSYVTN